MFFIENVLDPQIYCILFLLHFILFYLFSEEKLKIFHKFFEIQFIFLLICTHSAFRLILLWHFVYQKFPKLCKTLPKN